MKEDLGTIFVVATPIGNLSDISPRALQTLKDVSCILAEDTRHTKILLQHYQIKNHLISFHEHSEAKKIDFVIKQLEQGNDFALVSDAGTPLISDPGYKLVRKARQAGFNVSPIPGASSVTAALSASGCTANRFCFEGFLPAKTQARTTKIESLLHEARTMVFFESGKRICTTLAIMTTIFGPNRLASIGREITKKFESFYHGTLPSLVEQMSESKTKEKGEFVLIVEGSDTKSTQNEAQAEILLTELVHIMPLKSAVEIVKKTLPVNKNELYRLAVQLRKHANIDTKGNHVRMD